MYGIFKDFPKDFTIYLVYCNIYNIIYRVKNNINLYLLSN